MKEIEKYRSEGLSFFPIPFMSKQAAMEWKIYQERLPSEAEISQWFNGNQSNIAVVCGKVSGNLVVLDCDSQDKFSELAAIICKNIGIDDIRDFTRISKTSKGYHIWLRTKEAIKSQKFPKLDIKSEGGYIIAPPSVHPSGAQYEFVNDKPIVKVDNLKLIGIDIEQRSNEPSNQPGWVSQALQGVAEGSRNDTAIKLAGYFRNTQPIDVTERLLLDWNARNKPPMKEQELMSVIASAYSLPEHPPNGSINNSIIKYRGEYAKNSLKTGQVRDNFGTTSGWGEYSKRFDEVVKEACKISKRDIAETIGLKPTDDTFRKLIARRIDEGKIRPHRGSANIIEWINRDYKVTDLTSSKAATFLPIKMPLRLNELISIPPGSVIGIAGFTSAGKTSFLLEIAELNVFTQPMPVYYWYHEMSEDRLRIRIEDFPELIEASKSKIFKPVKQSDFEFWDVLEPDAINLIDYLDRDIDAYLIGQDIKHLQARLNTGIVTYAQQKPANRDFGIGGVASAKLSNLYLALDVKKQMQKTMYGICKVVKAKDWVDINPVHLYCNYHTGGKHGKLFMDGDWQRSNYE